MSESQQCSESDLEPTSGLGKCLNLILGMPYGLYSFFLHAHYLNALIAREPAPLSYFTCVQPGDVGYIRTGCFHLLFSAGRPLGNRSLGVDVPRTFKPLEVGEIVERAPLAAGSLCTSGVRGTRPRLAHSQSPSSSSSSPSSPYVHFMVFSPFTTSELYPRMLESSSSTSFRLTGGQGAALLTKYSTYREDVQRMGTFEKYAKEHHASWMTFARETGHGDVNPILVTGVDRTKDFAMLCYSNDDNDLRCDFTTSAPGFTSDWGTWHKTGLVYTNHGPQLRSSPSPRTADSPSSRNGRRTETGSDEYNQYVFVRYYTIRKRLGVPRIIKAAAGPHDLGGDDRDEEESPLQEQYDSDSGSDVASSLLDDGEYDDGGSVTSIETESDIAIHNPHTVRCFSRFLSTRLTPFQDERDDFDAIADYVFRAS